MKLSASCSVRRLKAGGIYLETPHERFGLTAEELKRLLAWLSRPKQTLFKVDCHDGGHIYNRRFYVTFVDGEVIRYCKDCKQFTNQTITRY